MAETDKLLAVLDMTEGEQWNFFFNQGLIPEPIALKPYSPSIEEWLRKHLADLAFRLRGKEVKRSNRAIVGHKKNARTGDIYEAMLKVYCCAEDDEPAGDNDLALRVCMEHWWTLYSQPIHWIVASLIAKEIATDGKAENNR